MLGRKKTLMLGLTLWVIGEVIQASSYSFGQLIAGRFIAGFGKRTMSLVLLRTLST
jgi:predicted MFS family arabinose efflux permease